MPLTLILMTLSVMLVSNDEEGIQKDRCHLKGLVKSRALVQLNR